MVASGARRKDKESFFANAKSMETNFHSQNLLHSEGCLDPNLERTANIRDISKGSNATEKVM